MKVSDDERAVHAENCAITFCAGDVAAEVDHPQRGELRVCESHAKQITELPADVDGRPET